MNGKQRAGEKETQNKLMDALKQPRGHEIKGEFHNSKILNKLTVSILMGL